MAESTNVEVSETPDEKKPSKLKQFRTNHPRITKAPAVTAGLLTVGALATALASRGDDSSESYDFDDAPDPVTPTED